MKRISAPQRTKESCCAAGRGPWWRTRGRCCSPACGTPPGRPPATGPRSIALAGHPMLSGSPAGGLDPAAREGAERAGGAARRAGSAPPPAARSALGPTLDPPPLPAPGAGPPGPPAPPLRLGPGRPMTLTPCSGVTRSHHPRNPSRTALCSMPTLSPRFSGTLWAAPFSRPCVPSDSELLNTLPALGQASPINAEPEWPPLQSEQRHGKEQNMRRGSKHWLDIQQHHEERARHIHGTLPQVSIQWLCCTLCASAKGPGSSHSVASTEKAARWTPGTFQVTETLHPPLHQRVETTAWQHNSPATYSTQTPHARSLCTCSHKKLAGKSERQRKPRAGACALLSVSPTRLWPSLPTRSRFSQELQDSWPRLHRQAHPRQPRPFFPLSSGACLALNFPSVPLSPSPALPTDLCFNPAGHARERRVSPPPPRGLSQQHAQGRLPPQACRPRLRPAWLPASSIRDVTEVCRTSWRSSSRSRGRQVQALALRSPPATRARCQDSRRASLKQGQARLGASWATEGEADRGARGAGARQGGARLTRGKEQAELAWRPVPPLLLSLSELSATLA